MSEGGWKKKTRGWSNIWTHPALDRAIVDGRGFGLNPGVRFDGKEYPTLRDAKRAALSRVKA